MKKTKKQLSPLQRKLLAGFLILVIVACWTFIGVKITIGPEKAKAYTAVNVGGSYSCRGSKEGGCGGSCSEGFVCTTRFIDENTYTCGCVKKNDINSTNIKVAPIKAFIK